MKNEIAGGAGNTRLDDPLEAAKVGFMAGPGALYGHILWVSREAQVHPEGKGLFHLPLRDSKKPAVLTAVSHEGVNTTLGSHEYGRNPGWT